MQASAEKASTCETLGSSGRCPSKAEPISARDYERMGLMREPCSITYVFGTPLLCLLPIDLT